MSSQSAGKKRPRSPASSSHNSAQPTQGSLSDSVESVKHAILSILKDTDWPRKSTDAADGLMTTMENALSVTNIPKDNLRIQAQHRTTLEQFITVMEGVQRKLEEASNAHGGKEKTSRQKITDFFASQKPNKCTEVLESCGNDVKGALATLPTQWNREVTTDDQLGGSDRSQPGAHTPRTGDAPTMVAPYANLDDEPISPDDRVNDSSKRREWLGMAKATFSVVEAIAGTIPVVGTYVGAAAKVGGIIIGLIQQLGSNEEAAKSLASHTLQLSDILEPFKHGFVERDRGDLTKLINNLQLELQQVERRIPKLNSTSVLKRVFSSSNHAEALKGYQESIQRALQQIQLLATLNTTTLIAELYDQEIREKQQRLLDREPYCIPSDKIDRIMGEIPSR